MEIVIAIILVVAAIVFFLYIFNAMLTAACPVCQRDEDTDETIIPIFPAFLWFCPNCGSTIKHKEIAQRRDSNKNG